MTDIGYERRGKYMKKRYYIWLFAVFSALVFSACGNRAENEVEDQPVRMEARENTPQIENADGTTEDLLEETPENIPEEHTGGIQMQELIIGVGGQQFRAALYDNEAAQALMERLPMTFDMKELHGNEKYYYLDEELPSDSESIDRIKAGDIMLFGSDCLVLFFDDFSTPYSYTRIGQIEDGEAFADALEDGTVEVTFEAGE